MWRVWLVLGSLVWCATIIASASINFFAGYDFGRSPVEAFTFGVLGVAADAWKAIGPIFIITLLRDVRIFTAATAGIVWMLCFAFAVSSSLGIAAHNRSARSDDRVEVRTAYERAIETLNGLKARRTALSEVASTADYETQIRAAFAKPLSGGTVATLSADCSKDVFRTRAACAEIANLRTQLTRARDAAQLDAAIANIADKIAVLQKRGGLRSSDPQSELISWLTFNRIKIGDVGLALNLILVAMIELISAFAPVVLHDFAAAARVTSRLVATQRDVPSIVASKTSAVSPLCPIGNVVEYLAERVFPDVDGVVSETMLYCDYQLWCGASFTPMSRSAFLREFDVLAERDLNGNVWRHRKNVRGFKLRPKTALLERRTLSG